MREKQIEPISVEEWKSLAENAVNLSDLSNEPRYLFNGLASRKGVGHETRAFRSLANIQDIELYSDYTAAGRLVLQHIDTAHEFTSLSVGIDAKGEITPANGDFLLLTGRRMGRTALTRGYLLLPNQP